MPPPAEDGATFFGCVGHTTVVLLLVVAVGATIPIHWFVGVSASAFYSFTRSALITPCAFRASCGWAQASLSAKEFGEATIHNAESNLFVLSTMAVALGHFASGAMLMTHSGLKFCDMHCDTKPVFFGGLLLGFLGLVCEWAGGTMALQYIGMVLIGLMNGLCGTGLLMLLLYRCGSRFKATAIGTYMALHSGFAELVGGVFGVLVIEKQAVCDYSSSGVNVSVTHDMCVDERRFIDSMSTKERCYCTQFRPTGPIVVLVCLCAATFFGLIYSDKHFNSKSLTSNDTVNCCLKAQRKRGGGGEGGRRIRRASPSPPSRTITNPQPGAGGLPRRETLRGNAGGGGDKRFTLNEDTAVLEATAGYGWQRVVGFVILEDQLLRACMVALMGGGLLYGGVQATIMSLNNHGLGRELDHQIDATEERAIFVCQLLAITTCSVLMGQASDRQNRKSFVLGGLMAIAFGAMLAASAIAYQTHVGFRRGELFMASVATAVGAASMYGAGIAAITERSLRIWRVHAVGLAMTCWELARVSGFLVVDRVFRQNRLVGLALMILMIFLVALFWVVVYKDERDELGAQESARDIVASESESEFEDDDDEESPPAAAPAPAQITTAAAGDGGGSATATVRRTQHP